MPEKQIPDENEKVPCAVCRGLVHLRSTAWFDPYNDAMCYTPCRIPYKGAYVHESCLSDKRKKEIAEKIDQERFSAIKHILDTYVGLPNIDVVKDSITAEVTNKILE